MKILRSLENRRFILKVKSLNSLTVKLSMHHSMDSVTVILITVIEITDMKFTVMPEKVLRVIVIILTLMTAQLCQKSYDRDMTVKVMRGRVMTVTVITGIVINCTVMTVTVMTMTVIAVNVLTMQNVKPLAAMTMTWVKVICITVTVME